MSNLTASGASISPPRTATTSSGGGYELRYSVGSSYYSAIFDVSAERSTFSAGTKYLVLPNGSSTSFTAGSVPTAAILTGPQFSSTSDL